MVSLVEVGNLAMLHVLQYRRRNDMYYRSLSLNLPNSVGSYQKLEHSCAAKEYGAFWLRDYFGQSVQYTNQKSSSGNKFIVAFVSLQSPS